MPALRLVKGENDLLFDDSGKAFIDLHSAHGTAFLGHAHPRIASAIKAQLDALWITGGLESDIGQRARERLERFFPRSHRVVGFYSAGVEASELAMRIARIHTGRPGIVGFEGNMHGKSLAASHLGWDNGDGFEIQGFARLPFVSACAEAEILEKLERTLHAGDVAGVFVEPMQGCGGGFEGSARFYLSLERLCRKAGAVLVCDEILTGFYRTGPLFRYQKSGMAPDVILVGKALGNGFPVSAVVAANDIAIDPRMLPGSTFSGNPLAAAAVCACLELLSDPEIAQMAGRIDAVLNTDLADLDALGVTTRGAGAARFLELPRHWRRDRLVESIFSRGVVVGGAGSFMRIMPAATIDLDRLHHACEIIREAFRVEAASSRGT